MYVSKQIFLMVMSIVLHLQTTDALRRCFRGAGTAKSWSSLHASVPLARFADHYDGRTSALAAPSKDRHRIFLRLGDSAKVVTPIVVCGPSGVGKGTLIARLLERYGSKVAFAVSHTTRNPRAGEVDGREYHFVSHEKMAASICRGEFIEYCEVHKNFYGTSIEAVSKIMASGQVCILDLDTQGVKALKALEIEGRIGFSARYVFIAPPSIDRLRARLLCRGTETPEQVDGRLKTAENELAWFHGNEGVFDAVVVNDDLEAATTELDDCFRRWNEETIN